MLIDSHCHLCYDVIKNDLINVIKDCEKHNIKILVNVGFNRENNECVLKFQEKINSVVILKSIGFHPVEVGKPNFKENYNLFLKTLEENIDKVSFIGEFGLDYYWIKNESQKELQRKIFLEICSLNFEKPLVLHIRDAWDDFLNLLDRIEHRPLVLHCYTGSKKVTKKILEYDDIYFSIATSILRNKSFLNVVKLVPIDRLLCETDSPYLHPFKDFPNVPSNVRYVYGLIAQVFEEPLEQRIYENFKKLVDIDGQVLYDW